eukprot:5432356-Prymnesium_polylepis.1
MHAWPCPACAVRDACVAVLCMRQAAEANELAAERLTAVGEAEEKMVEAQNAAAEAEEKLGAAEARAEEAEGWA